MGFFPDPSKRLRIVLAATGAFLVFTLLLGAVFWPVFLSGYAEKKTRAALERKFDKVEIGTFHLESDRLTLQHVHLHRGDVEAILNEVVVDYQLGFGFVDVSKVRVEGGIYGDASKLSMPKTSGEASSGPGRVHLENASLVLKNLSVDVFRDEARVTAVANATGSYTSEGLKADVRLEDVQATKPGVGTLKVKNVQTTLTSIRDPFPVTVEIQGASAEGPVMGSVKNVFDDVSGTVALLKGSKVRVDLESGGRYKWKAQGDLWPEEARFDMWFEADGVHPASFPFVKALPGKMRGALSANVHVTGDSEEIRAQGEVKSSVAVSHPKISRQTVDLSAEVDFHDVVVLPQERVVDGGVFEVKLGAKKVTAEVEVGRLDPDRGIYSAHVKVSDTPCQRVLEAVPEGLLPDLKGFELEGAASMNMEFHVFLEEPEKTGFVGGPILHKCRIVRLPQVVEMMKGPFSHSVRMKNGRVVTRLMTQGDYYYTPWDRIPPSLPAAVISTEDGSFWSHSGIRPHQLQASIRRNLKEGEFARGGSTITMQAAKNLLLTHERSVSRKLQEMFLTWVVERELGKQRIMELYLNAVEFGPGIYGVGHAAEHYFGKTPLELTTLESAFLATLLPRPIQRHEAWCRGALSPRYERYVHRVHVRMLKARRIKREDYDRGKAQGIHFTRIGMDDEQKCIDAGRAVGAGKLTQGALNGLTLGRADG